MPPLKDRLVCGWSAILATSGACPAAALPVQFADLRPCAEDAFESGLCEYSVEIRNTTSALLSAPDRDRGRP